MELPDPFQNPTLTYYQSGQVDGNGSYSNSLKQMEITSFQNQNPGNEMMNFHPTDRHYMANNLVEYNLDDVNSIPDLALNMQSQLQKPIRLQQISLSNRKRMDKTSDEYRKRRERNNVAVRKSREKAKMKSKETEERVKRLYRENEQLQKKVEMLQEEVSILRSMLSSVDTYQDQMNWVIIRTVWFLSSKNPHKYQIWTEIKKFVKNNYFQWFFALSKVLLSSKKNNKNNSICQFFKISLIDIYFQLKLRFPNFLKT